MVLEPVFTPADSSAEVTWSTSDATIATVDEGEVSGVKAGTATITAKLANGLTASTTVTVTVAS
ncbi:MAG: Ig-like domain-containing protein [Oenococcus sp.]|uniref:Ig-like domain-containing protein n=1 Tax=Oenococcus sp. TaxID=1979414 RepID=UPI0039EC584D